MYRMMIAAALLVTTAVASPVMAVESGATKQGIATAPVRNPRPQPVVNNQPPHPVVHNVVPTHRLHRVGGGG